MLAEKISDTAFLRKRSIPSCQNRESVVTVHLDSTKLTLEHLGVALIDKKITSLCQLKTHYWNMLQQPNTVELQSTYSRDIL